MNFRIFDSLTGSLAKLTIQVQNAVRSSVLDFQVNPALPKPAAGSTVKVIIHLRNNVMKEFGV